MVFGRASAISRTFRYGSLSSNMIGCGMAPKVAARCADGHDPATSKCSPVSGSTSATRVAGSPITVAPGRDQPAPLCASVWVHLRRALTRRTPPAADCCAWWSIPLSPVTFDDASSAAYVGAYPIVRGWLVPGISGIFIPQGWRLDLVGIEPAQQWPLIKRLAQEADAGPWTSLWVYDHFHTVPAPTQGGDTRGVDADVGVRRVHRTDPARPDVHLHRLP